MSAVPSNAGSSSVHPIPTAGPAAHQNAPEYTAAHRNAPRRLNVQNEAKLRAAIQGVTETIAPALAAVGMATSAAEDLRRQTTTTAHQNVPECTAAHRNIPSDARAKMGNEAKPLTAPQLAAIRLLLAGRKPIQVARELGIDRHTLLRWERMPVFAAELGRLHDRLCGQVRGAPVRVPMSSPAPGPVRRTVTPRSSVERDCAESMRKMREAGF